MIQYIPSEQQREYLKEKGVVFTDIQKAAMIWNEPYCSCEEKLSSLEERILTGVIQIPITESC